MKRFNKSFYILSILVALTFDAASQDVSFSQFYKNPIYLNPSLTALQSCGRLYTNYRETALGGLDNRALSLAFDLPFVSTNSGLGGMFQLYEEGLMRSGIFAAQFSRKVTVYSDLFMTFGIEAGGYFRGYNKAEIVLPSQVLSSTTDNTFTPQTSVLFDAAAGFGLNYKTQFAGFAVRHVTEPAVKSKQLNSMLYRRYIVHYAARIPYKLPGQVEGYIAPQVIFEKQKGNNNMTTGVYVVNNSVGGGVWIRNSFPYQVSFLILMATINTKNFEFSYSYDFPVNGFGITNGGHEVAIIYYLPSFSKRYHKLNSRNCLSF